MISELSFDGTPFICMSRQRRHGIFHDFCCDGTAEERDGHNNFVPILAANATFWLADTLPFWLAIRYILAGRYVIGWSCESETMTEP